MISPALDHDIKGFPAYEGRPNAPVFYPHPDASTADDMPAQELGRRPFAAAWFVARVVVYILLAVNSTRVAVIAVLLLLQIDGSNYNALGLNATYTTGVSEVRLLGHLYLPVTTFTLEPNLAQRPPQSSRIDGPSELFLERWICRS